MGHVTLTTPIWKYFVMPRRRLSVYKIWRLQLFHVYERIWKKRKTGVILAIRITQVNVAGNVSIPQSAYENSYSPFIEIRHLSCTDVFEI